MLKHPLFIIAVLSASSVLGQETIASTGQTHTSGQLIVSQTVGETITGAITNGITVNQGFHQNENLSTGIYERGESLELTVYPNPFVDRVVISGDEELGNISIFSTTGVEVLQHVNQKGQKTAELQLSHLSAGHYMIRVTSVNRLKSSAYSIIKQ